MSSTAAVMNFSLIDKFRGAWLGSYLGAIKAPSQGSKEQFLEAGEIARLGAQSLVKVGSLDLVHWQEQMQIGDPSLLSLAGTLQICEAIQAALPVILFYHEQPHKLAPALLSTLDFWLYAPESAAIGLGVAEAIAFLLRKNPCPQEIIEQTNLGEMLQLSPQFWQELPCLELAIKEITHHTAPSHVPMAIACYCFLCTPEDFSLSIRRAKIAPKPELVTPLVGILSGAYNGLRGVPRQWYAESFSLSESLLPKSSIDLLPTRSKQVFIGDAQYQLIDQLFAVWAGHYQIPSNTAGYWQDQIVNAPK
jgi:hypothetical protein